ncbi:MAG: SLBB domain-containing protein [Nostocales cyanobacterium 94392]|nr:SLBB domain-containing protein [Nostocales cyanobacterium 94392]
MTKKIHHHLFLSTTSLVLLSLLKGVAWLPSPAYAQVVSLVNTTGDNLKSGDRLRLTIIGFPDLSGEQLILSDGTLQVGMAGYIDIAGLTPAQATSKITDALRPYLRYPQVGLTVISYRPPRISITGEVRRPGPYLMVSASPQETNPNNSTSLENSNVQTLSQVLMLAGGVTPNADLRNIVIRRTQPSIQETTNKLVNPKTEATKTDLQVNLWNTIQSGNLSADVRVYDGDEIIVPTAQLSGSDQQRLLASTIAPSAITVQVAGEVQRPGSVQVSPKVGVSGAVAAAGGLTDKARRKSLTLLRLSPEGRIIHQTFAFGADSPPLMEGDVVVVEQSSVHKTLDIIGKIFSPLSNILFLLK